MAAVSSSLINGPEIILADEPTGNLDSMTGRGIMELLARINRERRQTIILVTHSAEAAGYARRVVHVKDGVLSW